MKPQRSICETPVGTSFHLCVLSIARGEIDLEEVDYIITSTQHPDNESWGKAIVNYARADWREVADKATEIANRLRTEGKLIQPRLHGCPHPSSDSPFWVGSVLEVTWE